MIIYSIIIPVFNAEKYIKKCIESILEYNSDDIEIIAVNDGSVDSSYEILKSISSRDKRLRVFSQQNEGVSAARNRGISEAKGKWLLFCDADDYFVNAGIFGQITELLYEYPDIEYIRFSASKCEKQILNKENKEKLILNTIGVLGNGFNTSTSTVWNGVYNSYIVKINKILFDSELFMGEDILFNLQYFSKIHLLLFSTLKYYFYRTDNISASRGWNSKVPKRDLHFQECLISIAKENAFYTLLTDGILYSTLNGILLSFDLYFSRVPFSAYRRTRKEIRDFLSTDVYLCSLERIADCKEINGLKKIYLWLIRKKLYFFAILLKKVLRK